jgi:hypothetical protein
MLVPGHDIFQKRGAGLIWVQAVENLESAKKLKEEPRKQNPYEYVVYDQRTQQIVSCLDCRRPDTYHPAP